MRVDLEYYKVFYHVVKEGNFTRAGEVLCISQPAVSQAIRLLEDALGSRLFIRVPRGVKLTTEGEVLYSYIQRGYETILAGEEKFRKMLDLEMGEIRIGASDMTLQFYLLPFLELFHEKFPKIKVKVTNAPTPVTLELLQEGQIDFAAVSEPFSIRPELTCVPVRPLEDCFIAGNRFREYEGKILDWTELEHLPVICLEQNTSTRRFLDEFLSRRGITLKPEFELAMSDIIVKFTLRNLGIGCVVKDFAKEYLESGQMFELKFRETLPARNICIVTQDANPISSAGKQLIRMLGIEKSEN